MHLDTYAPRAAGGFGRREADVYAYRWTATGAGGVLAPTMLDAYAVADAILADHHFGDGVAGACEVPAAAGYELQPQ